MIQFAYTILYVKDVAKTIAFYEKALGLQRKFLTDDNTYGELVTGATTLSFASIELAKSNLKDGFQESDPAQKPFAMEIAFTTDDVAATVKSCIAAGAQLMAEPKTKPWGQIVAYVRDPDGFLVEVCTAMG
jgi:lactoylglutathione lyase